MTVCSGCHELADIDAKPPKTAEEAKALVQRMVKDNDAKLTSDEIVQIDAYLSAHFVSKSI